MYSQKVIDKFQNPKGAGELEGANAIGTVGNASCGDVMKMQLKIVDDVIVEAKFQTFGCAAAIAASDMVVEMVTGKTLEQALAIKNQDVVDALDGLPAKKLHCSVLAEEAIKAAIADYKKGEKC